MSNPMTLVLEAGTTDSAVPPDDELETAGNPSACKPSRNADFENVTASSSPVTADAFTVTDVNPRVYVDRSSTSRPSG